MGCLQHSNESRFSSRSVLSVIDGSLTEQLAMSRDYFLDLSVPSICLFGRDDRSNVPS